MVGVCGSCVRLSSVAVKAKKTFAFHKNGAMLLCERKHGVQQHLGNGTFSPAVNTWLHIRDEDVPYVTDRPLPGAS